MGRPSIPGKSPEKLSVLQQELSGMTGPAWLALMAGGSMQRQVKGSICAARGWIHELTDPGFLHVTVKALECHTAATHLVPAALTHRRKNPQGLKLAPRAPVVAGRLRLNCHPAVRAHGLGQRLGARLHALGRLVCRGLERWVAVGRSCRKERCWCQTTAWKSARAVVGWAALSGLPQP